MKNNKKYVKMKKDVIGHLKDLGVWEDIDVDLVDKYVALNRIFDECEKAVEEEGPTVWTQHGIKTNPHLTGVNTISSAIVRVANQLGIGGAARKKFKLGSTEDPRNRKNPWATTEKKKAKAKKAKAKN